MERRGFVMFCTVVSLFLAFSLPVHGSFRKSSGSSVKLPGCAIWAERLDSQTERDSFYEGLPETDDSVETVVPVSLDTSALPFGYPDSVTGVIEGIPEPGSVCIEPSGLYLYVSSFSTGAVHVLRVSSLEQVRILSTGFEPDPLHHHPGTLEMHPRGDYIYITNPADGTVTVVRSLDGGLVTSIDIGQNPSDICFSPAGDRAYVTCRGSDQVFILE
jgi:DNA-binding beta-propeller fold protein YncE